MSGIVEWIKLWRMAHLIETGNLMGLYEARYAYYRSHGGFPESVEELEEYNKRMLRHKYKEPTS